MSAVPFSANMGTGGRQRAVKFAFDRWAAKISLWPLGTPDCDRAQPLLLEMGWVGLTVGPPRGKYISVMGSKPPLSGGQGCPGGAWGLPT